MTANFADDVDRDRLAAVCRRYGVATLAVFGSVARGADTPSSDLDLLYELAPGAHIGWEVDDLADELSEIFGRSSLASPCIRCLPIPSSERRGRSMQRDLLLLHEMIDAAEQAQHVVAGHTAAEIAADWRRRDSLLWNFTVLGEAAGVLHDAAAALEGDR